MDGQVCDRHPSAKAQARVLLPNLGELFFCRHCADTLNFGPDFYIEYATQELNTKEPAA